MSLISADMLCTIYVIAVAATWENAVIFAYTWIHACKGEKNLLDGWEVITMWGFSNKSELPPLDANDRHWEANLVRRQAINISEIAISEFTLCLETDLNSFSIMLAILC